METKVTAAGAGAAAGGVAQTILLRELVDRKYPTKNFPQLKGFGYLSAIIGLISGGSALTVGAIGSTKDKNGRQRLADIYNEVLIDYGATALVGAILSGVFPAVTADDCTAAGGTFVNGICYLNPPAGTTSMEPGVQTAAYKAPIPHLTEGMDAVKKMTAELSRLGQQVQSLTQENASLKAMQNGIVVRGGTIVRNPKEPSGFMTAAPTLPPVTENYPIGHPETATAKKHGFMSEAMSRGYGF